MVHLWTGGPAPAELVELNLCRYVYHCDPETLSRQNPETIFAHLAIMEAEAEIARKRQENNSLSH